MGLICKPAALSPFRLAGEKNTINLSVLLSISYDLIVFFSKFKCKKFSA